MLHTVDLGTGAPVAGWVDERDPQAMSAWLAPLDARPGTETFVTYDPSTYRTVARTLGLRHQICHYHLRRWIGRQCRAWAVTLPEAWTPLLGTLEQTVVDLLAQGNAILLRLWRQARRLPVETPEQAALRPLVRNVLIRLNEAWAAYRPAI